MSNEVIPRYGYQRPKAHPYQRWRDNKISKNGIVHGSSTIDDIRKLLDGWWNLMELLLLLLLLLMPWNINIQFLSDILFSHYWPFAIDDSWIYSILGFLTLDWPLCILGGKSMISQTNSNPCDPISKIVLLLLGGSFIDEFLRMHFLFSKFFLLIIFFAIIQT